MSRKAKFNKEEKIQACEDYLFGRKSVSQISKDIGLYDMTIYRWAKRYKVHGPSIFNEKTRNSSYSKEFKLKLIHEYLEGRKSIDELMATYNISSNQTIRNWVLMYNNGIEIKDYDPKGEVYTMKARKTTVEEKIEIVKWCIAHEKSYKEAADKFDMPYSLVYQWVQKYLNNGVDALKIDGRGRKTLSEVQDLTEGQKLRIEYEKLQKQLERAQLEIEVLKKKQYFKDLLDSQRSDKKKHI